MDHPGTSMVCGQFALPFNSDMAHPFLVGFDFEIGAETLEHLFSVVARHHRLDHRGDAGRVETGQQHGRFDCAEAIGTR